LDTKSNREGATGTTTLTNTKIKWKNEKTPKREWDGIWGEVETRIDRRAGRIEEVTPLGDNAKISEGRVAT